jgi:hypothetical protein
VKNPKPLSIVVWRIILCRTLELELGFLLFFFVLGDVDVDADADAALNVELTYASIMALAICTISAAW